MQGGNSIESCLQNIDTSSEVKATRQFLTCLGEVLSKKYQNNVKAVVVDNGVKYNYVLYLEVYSKDVLDNVLREVEEGLRKLQSASPSLQEYLKNMKVQDWGNEKYIMLSKEYVIVKYVLR